MMAANEEKSGARTPYQLSPRHVRFHGPYIGIHSFWDWGYAFHKTWLDNENLDQTLTVDLRS